MSKSTNPKKSASAPVKASVENSTEVNPSTETAVSAPVSDAPVASAPRVLMGEKNEELRGTPAQLVARGVRLNGWPLAVGDFAGLRKFHFKTAMDSAGYVQKIPGTKGKSAEIVQLLPAPGFEFSI